ncbi:LCP family protein [Ruminiclostridium cellulolyticum]|uniref:Cell envelope-related transcriptional attenuator n=1 Tax=Ruminiclostridium cellulolyticum (strain ATCC 35319 / DSM 5812 / JCM 6584 / H10) TaxID=394503 RepID=B8I7C2_RUMCH|nr:LCP family protein [Ruminiclostridium cellulolyticum]ACL75046.1 cell envelope-related transcriptional attenuator [Ruminiclostridium cellulolyticum H10]
MNTRKFTYIITIVVGLFLFGMGTVFLYYANSVTGAAGNNSLPAILEGLNATTNKEPMNFFLLVGDKSSGNTDSMLVANYNPQNSEISIVTVPRDTNVKLKNNILPKINAAYAAGGRNHEGARYASEIVSNLTGININYYVHINISAIKKITDMLGGVYFDVPVDMKYDDPTQNLHINLKKGYQLLDGDKVEQLLRFRKPNGERYTKELKEFYDGSDIKRTEMQMKFIKEFIKQKLKVQNIPKLNPVLNYAFENIITNMTLSDALKMTSGLISISPDNFNSFRLDGKDKVINKGWYYIYNGNMINIETKESLPAAEIVEKYFFSPNGIATPSGELYVPDESNDDADETKAPPAVKKKPAIKKQNPSNTETDTKGTSKG